MGSGSRLALGRTADRTRSGCPRTDRPHPSPVSAAQAGRLWPRSARRQICQSARGGRTYGIRPKARSDRMIRDSRSCWKVRWRVRHVGSSTIKATHGFFPPQLPFACSARGPAHRRDTRSGIERTRAFGALRRWARARSQNRWHSQHLKPLTTQLPSEQS